MNQLPVLLCHEHWTTPTTGTTASRPPSCIAISWWGSAAGALWPFTATTPGRSTPPPQAVHCQQHPGSHPHPGSFSYRGTSNDNEQAASVLMSSGTVAWSS
uniref:Uncharacterized protein n=1 Tax=Triticum urartu TaxID=4572 RepID=A0A8R7RA36_TRIUA